VDDFLFFIEPYIVIIYIIHIVISFILALVLTPLIKERFKRKSEEIQQRDAHRLEEIQHRRKIYKKLFNVALHKNNRITNILFLFLFNLAMPVVGYIFSIWIVWYLKNVTYQKKVAHTNILNLDEFGLSFLKVERIFGEGSMMNVMNSEYTPRSKKLKALSSLSGSLSPVNLKIIKSTLTSRDDEIRMFGYSIINKAEKSINIKINAQLYIFRQEEAKEKDNQDKERMANAAKELANLYWELVYTELSHDSLKAGFLNEVKKYVQVAKDYFISSGDTLELEVVKMQKELSELSDEEHTQKLTTQLKLLKDKLLQMQDTRTKLFVLMGKVYMKEKNYEKASTEFIIAQELQENKTSFILPYIAEIQYLLGNYTVVSAIMSKSDDLSLNATLYPIIEQWKSS
jgi:hypothetical protein